MNKKTFAALSLILALAPFLTVFIPVKSIDIISILVIVFIVCELLAVIFGIIGIKGSKGMSIAGIVIGIIMVILSVVIFAGLKLIKDAKNCVNNGNGKATCKILDSDIDIPTFLLKESQMK